MTYQEVAVILLYSKLLLALGSKMSMLTSLPVLAKRQAIQPLEGQDITL